MSHEIENEEKEQLVATSQHDKEHMIEIKRIPHELRCKTPKPQTDDDDEDDVPKRTFSFVDTLNALPEDFKQNIINGNYDKDKNDIYESTRGYLSACKQNGNWCSCIWIVVLLISIILFFIGLCIDSENGLYVLLIIPIFISWFLYSSEWYFISSTPDDLNIVQHKSEVDELILNLHKIEPQIIWKSNCFHYEYDQHDEDVKVITHEVKGEYSYTRCRDNYTRCSLNEFELTQLTLFKTFKFADNETKKDYDEAFHAFCDKHNKDEYQSVDVLMEMKGFKTRILVNGNNENKGKYWNNKWYNILSCLCFSPCYRAKFHSIIGIKSHIIQKEITTDIKDVDP